MVMGGVKGEGTGYKTWSSKLRAAGDIAPPHHPDKSLLLTWEVKS